MDVRPLWRVPGTIVYDRTKTRDQASCCARGGGAAAPETAAFADHYGSRSSHRREAVPLPSSRLPPHGHQTLRLAGQPHPVEQPATIRRLQLTPPARRAQHEMATRGFCATGWYASIAVRPTQIRRTACRTALRGGRGTTALTAGCGSSPPRRSGSAASRPPVGKPWTRATLPPPRSARSHARP